jgi:hypothetical protein
VRHLRSLVIVATVLASIGVVAPVATGVTTKRTFVTMYSQNGEYIGQGEHRLFLPSMGSITVTGNAGYVSVGVSGGTHGDEFTLTFGAPSGTRFDTRTYLRAQRTPFASAGHPGIDIYGDGRGCNEISGRFDVKDFATDASGTITRLWIVFEQHCEGDPPALFGELMYREPQPVKPFAAAPIDVWFPDTYVGGRKAEAVVDIIGMRASAPAPIGSVAIRGAHRTDYELEDDACSGEVLSARQRCQVRVRFGPSVAGPRTAVLVVRDANGVANRIRLDGIGIGGTTSVTFASDPGDHVGQGQTYAYDPANAVVVVEGDEDHIGGRIEQTLGDWWYYEFDAPTDQPFAPGTTFDSTSYPGNDSGAGMSVFGNGRGCQSTGSFTINDVVFGPDATVTHLSLDFEQHCEGMDPAFRGEIRYRVPGADAVPPVAPTGLVVDREPTGRRALISWSNPGVGDLAYVIVRFSRSAISPLRPASQFHAYAGPGTSTVVTGLDPDRPFSVSVFPVDSSGNTGRAARATA